MTGCHPSPSPAGLTRGSIFFARTLTKKMDGRVKPGHDGGTSFAGLGCAAMLACNDHTTFVSIAHGPHCDHRADAVRGGAGAGAAIRYERAGDSSRACGYECTAGGR